MFSIEDPFEVDYDVAHVLKITRHQHIRGEMLRAAKILSSGNPHCMEELLEEAPLPFWYKEKYEHSR